MMLELIAIEDNMSEMDESELNWKRRDNVTLVKLVNRYRNLKETRIMTKNERFSNKSIYITFWENFRTERTGSDNFSLSSQRPEEGTGGKTVLGRSSR